MWGRSSSVAAPSSGRLSSVAAPSSGRLSSVAAPSSGRRDSQFDAERLTDRGAENHDENGNKMPTTERELADDAQWKLIQKNTFTNWANEHLKHSNLAVTDLETDLSDGVRLIVLVEVLSGKIVSQRYNKRPTHRTQKFENVTLSLEFLQVVEKIKLVNIDSSDIVDGNLKLILGLIWMLILHYAISMPTWDGEEREVNKVDQTPKQKLLRWIISRIPEKSIRNFTTDWNDGTAIGALVDALAPGLCPDWATWDPRDSVRNATEAMEAAERWLDVPQLIKPKEMCNPIVDELSMMTYLSQFPNAKLKTGAPLRPKTNPSKVRAYGPGLEMVGNTVGSPANFTIETFNAGRGEPEVVVVNPRGTQEQCQLTSNNDRNETYSGVFVPMMTGQYQLTVKFAGQPIPKSPFYVKVDEALGDASKVTAVGPGLDKSGVIAKSNTYFDINTKNAGSDGPVEVVILDPSGRKDTVRPSIVKKPNGALLVEYTPVSEGLHKVNVLFAGKPISNSPFPVTVSSASANDAKKCYATGRLVQPKGIRVGDDDHFKVHTENAGGDGDVGVNVVGPSGLDERVRLTRIDPVTHKGSFDPKRPGQYLVNISYNGQPIARSPFKVEVGPKKDGKIRVFGPGLEQGVVGYPACFIVETNGETGALGFSIEGPSQAKIDCKDNGDGSADISYWPTAPGEYAVHILCDEEDIPGSPYMAEIGPATSSFDPTKVEASGTGLLKTGGATVGKWAEFAVDARRAGVAPLHVAAVDAGYGPVEVVARDNKDGTFFCRYMPKRGVKHTVVISYGGVSVPNGPFRVLVQDASNPARVRVFGPSVEGPVKAFQPTYLIVDCSQAGPGDVAIALTNERGLDVPVETIDNGDNTFRVEFEPVSVGTYNASVYFADQEIPISPCKIRVESNVNVGNVTVQGLDSRVFLYSPNDFTVDARSVAPLGQGKVKAILTDPAGSRAEVFGQNNADGTYLCIYMPTKQGLHRLDVTYDGAAIPKSPFNVNVVSGSDPSRVKLFGPGLKGGCTNQPQTFTVQTRGAGPGGISLSVDGPSEAKVSCQDVQNGTFSVEYLPTKSGIYNIAVKFAEKPIPGSPFPVEIVDEVSPQKVKCYGPGLEPKGVRKGQPGIFTVDASQAGVAPIEITATDSKGRKRLGQVKPRGDGTFDATYYLEAEGPCKVDVTFGGQPVTGSPFASRILPIYDANKVIVSGEGVNPTGVVASLPTTFFIDTRDAGQADLDVIILDPEGDFVQPKILDNGDNTYVVTYTPSDIGRFAITIKYGGDLVPLAPFYVKTSPTGDASKIKILDHIEDVIPVGEEYVINLNKGQAGNGNVTCAIHSPNKSDVDIDVIDNRDGTVRVAYTPHLPGAYTVNLKFGGQPVPKGQFNQQAIDPKTLIKKQERPSDLSATQPINCIDGLDPFDFFIPVGPVFSFVSAVVTTPSGLRHSPKLEDNHDGTVKINYRPVELGLHRLDLAYNKDPVEGSPFFFFVHSIRPGQVAAFGPGLSHGIVGKLCRFTIITKDAGEGGLSLAVEGPSKAEIVCADNKDGTCSVTYLPSATGEYSIVIKFADQHIIGSPFTAKIVSPAGDGQKKSATVGSSSEVSLGLPETDIADLTASIRSPSGKEEPCPLKRLSNGQLGISFTPREVGDYLVNVYRNGKHIPNSPFRINVSESQIGNAKRVKVYGKGISTGTTNEINEFFVDTKKAGYGSLGLSIEGPSKADVDCQDNDGLCRVTYTPTEPGNYVVNVTFADEHVTGSPFLVKIAGSPSGRVTERIVKQKEAAADVTNVGSECQLSLKIPGVKSYDLEASVVNPSRRFEPCKIEERGNDQYSIMFIPREIGIHLVNIKHKGSHIPGCPFPFTVGPITDGGALKVRALGPGLEKGEVNAPCTFNVYTREAGAGGLSVAIEGPSKAEIDFQDRKDGSCEVSYTCTEPGDYYLSVKFNDDHIPGSPFKVFLAPSADSAKQTNIHNLKEGNRFEINKPTALTVDWTGANGKLDARVVAPSGAVEEALVKELDNAHFGVRFVPRENGLNLVHIRSDGDKHIPGSPFRVMVGQDGANASLVEASGEGLKSGKTGHLCKFVVNTLRAGTGALAVTIDGPSKVQLSCGEVEAGYEFKYTPSAPGDYLVNVKYAGNTHIRGSPFKAHIEGLDPSSSRTDQPEVVIESVTKMSTTQKFVASNKRVESDASKITATGTGLKRANVNKEATFTVDTSNAGYNILMAGVLGPGPNVPCEEVHTRHTGNRQYSVNYIVHERGSYLLYVKWGEEHIPGSPFQIDVQ